MEVQSNLERDEFRQYTIPASATTIAKRRMIIVEELPRRAKAAESVRIQSTTDG